ncbi:hypothetical protein [Sphingomonas sp. VNH70]|uniref:hypothetical protein n=1 Tax=Sphingomonas silueang TaxID=3156617 RepID=UPI0032B5A436
MDLILLLEQAIQELPKGDHSTGLNAIVRHVKAAIRHYERDKAVDPDACTDAIYRTNQAYEGSLKEAYRVLAGKDPAKVSPFDIESYLEGNGTVRPRVLTKFTRYRQDYRNPSTHDYKLDFDHDEALLAIIAVCGFANLLVHQIKSKINSAAAQVRVSRNADNDFLNSLKNTDFPEAVARICFSYTQESAGVDWFEYEKGVSESIKSYGIESKLFLLEENDDDTNDANLWDVTATNGKVSVGIDSRIYRGDKSSSGAISLRYRINMHSLDTAGAAIVIIRSYHPKEYSIYRINNQVREAYVIFPEEDQEQLDLLQSEFGDFEQLSISEK